MCGRLDLSQSDAIDELLDRLHLPQFEHSPNVAPTQTVPVIVQIHHLELHPMHWWLTPSWVTEPSHKFSMFNARAETLATSRAFKAPLQRRRCVIPITGFYEWLREGKTSQPYRLIGEGPPLLLGGIWEVWQRHDSYLESFAIITTEAVPEMQWLHNRQPLIIPEVQLSTWLNPDTPLPELHEILLPHLPFPLLATPVSPAVNNARYQGNVTATGEPVSIWN